MYKRILLFLFLFLCPVILLAQGKIKGRITDLESGEPLIGANVVIEGTSLGASSDANGDYVINNVTAGVYSLKATYIGYQAVTLQNIRVNAQLTTTADFRLPAEGVTTQQVEVTAERPLVNPSNTNAIRTTTNTDIEALPVRGINNILALTPGVTLQDNAIFIRGSRQDEVGYYLEGANITNPLVGGRQVTVVQDAVEEIQVQAGGFTAEFGGANAGIVRQQFKSGTSDYKGSIEYVTDNLFRGTDFQYGANKVLGSRWFGYNEATATFSGPVVDQRFKFFGLFNYNFIRDRNPQPFSGMNLGVITDPGTGDAVDFNYPAGPVLKNSQESYTGTGTLSLDFNPIILRLVGTFTDGTRYNPYSAARNTGNIQNLLNSDRIEQINSTDGSFSLKGTHLITPTTYYEINAGYSFSTTHIFDPILKDNFIGYGDSLANANAGVIWSRRPENSTRYAREPRYNIFTFAINAPGDVVADYQKNKFETFTFSGAFSTTIKKQHSFKIGGDLQLFTIRNYSFGNEAVFALAGLFAANDSLPASDPLKVSRDEIIINRGVNNYGYDLYGNESSGGGILGAKKPIFASGYVQDQIEFNDLILNVGVRLDYFDIDNKKMMDPSRPENSINFNTGEAIESGWVDVPTFTAVSPRLGFSFPVSEQTVFHAQYGKFVQQTRLRDVYQGFYATSSNLRGGFEITAPVGFDIKPTRTTQYEVGFTQQIGQFASFDITGFYKDILDQVVFDKQFTASGSPFKSYNILRNGDFATTKGVEISFNMRRFERLLVNGSVTFQDAQGTGSFPNSARGIVGAPLDGVTIFKPQYISPLEYNSSVKGNLSLDYRFGKDDGPSFLSQFGVSALLTFDSGHPFTTGIGGADLEGDARDRQPTEPLNSSTTPWTYQVDLRIDKTFSLFNTVNTNIYIMVINVFDTKNVENVFLRTGSPDEDGYLSDPTQGGQLVQSYGADYARLYRAVNLGYYEQWRTAVTGAPYTTNPFMFGPPRQVRLGLRLDIF